MEMNFFDLRDFEDKALIEADLCIIGSGPAGLTIAKEFAGTRIDVVILESGGSNTDEQTQKLYEIESIGDPRIINQELIRRRVLGGSSHIWTGRCAPFDELDFEYRDWIQYSGWPIRHGDLGHYIDRAAEYFGLAPAWYDESLWYKLKAHQPESLLDDKFLSPFFWQFCKSFGSEKRAVDFGRDLDFQQAYNVRLLFHANVTHINTNTEATHVTSVQVSTLERKEAVVKAKVLVLACGGIENARLLLASNRVMPQGLGNQHDVVGRYLMDHCLYRLGHFAPEDSYHLRDRFGHYWLDDDQGRHVYLHGISLSPEVQRNKNLLNCHAFIEEHDIPDDDSWNSIRYLISDFKSRKISQKSLQNLQTVLSNFGEVSQGLHRRIVKHRPEIREAKTIQLHCMLEQLPDPNSRIRLSQTRKDSLGMPISEIDWKISDLERQTALKMVQLISQEFTRLNLPTPSLSSWIKDDENWRNYLPEKAHPTGSTRLSTNPKMGVVDVNLEIHGVKGIFVAGSSVFPTSGAANPTLMIVAMSIRLAEWLKATHFKEYSRRAD